MDVTNLRIIMKAKWYLMAVVLSFTALSLGCATTYQHARITKGRFGNLLQKIEERLPAGWFIKDSRYGKSKMIVILVPEKHREMSEGIYNPLLNSLWDITDCYALEMRYSITKRDIADSIDREIDINSTFEDKRLDFILNSKKPIFGVEDEIVHNENLRLFHRIERSSAADDNKAWEIYPQFKTIADWRSVNSVKVLEERGEEKSNGQIFLFTYGAAHMEVVLKEFEKKEISFIYLYNHKLLDIGFRKRKILNDKYLKYISEKR